MLKPKIVRSTILNKVFASLFSKSEWGVGRSPTVLLYNSFRVRL